eukprot:TRINITY_DN50990_c0_g1_i1.p1 TRINITY_DN50990_c0_g1~~TRINITY_DN50990_c0_g1_i1.p1  ORF type:complete len:347 (+),score=97.42 TRINITY_DN50990_c0_g1_i1:78-1118(+)
MAAGSWVQRLPPLKCAPAGWFSAEAVQSVRWSPDDRLVAGAGFDGKVVGFDGRSGKRDFIADCNTIRVGAMSSSPTTDAKRPDPIPITCIRWRPQQRYVLIVGRSNGSLLQWDAREDRCISAWEEEGNEIYSLDVKRDGTKICTAGQDACLRIWDANSGTILQEYHTSGEFETSAHALRIYAARWAGTDDNIIATAGWENTVRIWDLRQEKCVREFFGPHVTGEGIDVSSGQVLTASHRIEDQLELWDVGTGKKICGFGGDDGTHKSMLSCCQFTRQGGWVAVGGGGGRGLQNCGAVYERQKARDAGGVPEADMPKPIMACDFAGQENAVAFGDGKGQIHVLELKK